MTKKDPTALAIKKLAAECSRSERCTSEIKEKMRRWKLTDGQQRQVLAYLTDNKYVDDKRYARLYVRDKMRFNKWGPRKIEQGLWAKHVDESIYRPFLDEVTLEEWQDVLAPLLQSKRKDMATPIDYEARMKLIRYAVGRGFTMEMIEHCLACDE